MLMRTALLFVFAGMALAKPTAPRAARASPFDACSGVDIDCLKAILTNLGPITADNPGADVTAAVTAYLDNLEASGNNTCATTPLASILGCAVPTGFPAGLPSPSPSIL